MSAFDNLSDKEFIAALMRGNPAEFKAGYSADNAVKAVCEQREINDPTRVEVMLVWADGYEVGLTEGRAVVLAVRDPDYPTEFTTEGNVDIIDIDLGSQFDGAKGFSDLDEAEQAEWLDNQRQRVTHLPESSKARREVEKICTELEES